MPCTQGKASVFVNFSPVADTDHQDDHPYIKGGMASLAKGRRIPLWEGFDPNPVPDSLCENAKPRADKLPKRELPQPGIPGENIPIPEFFEGILTLSPAYAIIHPRNHSAGASFMPGIGLDVKEDCPSQRAHQRVLRSGDRPQRVRQPVGQSGLKGPDFRVRSEMFQPRHSDQRRYGAG